MARKMGEYSVMYRYAGLIQMKPSWLERTNHNSFQVVCKKRGKFCLIFKQLPKHLRGYMKEEQCSALAKEQIVKCLLQVGISLVLKVASTSGLPQLV